MLHDPTCEQCREDDEQLNHLYFQCRESKKIWDKVKSLCMIQRKEHVLEEEIIWMAKLWHQKSFEHKLIRLAFAVMAYQIWRARNELIFQNKKWDAVCMMRRVQEEVKAGCLHDEKNTRRG